MSHTGDTGCGVLSRRPGLLHSPAGAHGHSNAHGSSGAGVGLLALPAEAPGTSSTRFLLGVGHAAPHFPAAAPGSPARPLQLIPTPPPSLPPPLAAPPQGFLRSHTHSRTSVRRSHFLWQVISWANQMAAETPTHSQSSPHLCLLPATSRL